MPTAKLKDNIVRQKLTNSNISLRKGKLKILDELMLKEANKCPMLPPSLYWPKYSEGKSPKKMDKNKEPKKKAIMRV